VDLGAFSGGQSSVVAVGFLAGQAQRLGLLVCFVATSIGRRISNLFRMSARIGGAAVAVKASTVGHPSPSIASRRRR